MTLTVGSLFTGYGGLDLALDTIHTTRLAWVADNDPGAKLILNHRFPNTPNLDDITTVDWATVEPVDIITGGSPCQDLSHAGKRGGMNTGTRSNLWVTMREAIAALRPSLVVWENVRGAYSADADSALEFCTGCMGDAWYRGSVLRALGRVLGDLSDLGYDTRWHGLRAADVGAPHGRFRVFVVAYPADAGRERWERRSPALCGVAGVGSASGEPDRLATPALLPTPTSSDTNGAGAHGAGGADLRTAVSLLPTPRATDGTKGGPGQRGSSGDLMLPSAVTLLPTPAVNDMGEGKTVEAWDEWTAKMQAVHDNGNGHGKSLAIEAQRLLPTPTSQTFGTQHGSDPTRQTVYSLDAMAAKGMLCDPTEPNASTVTSSSTDPMTTANASGTRTPSPDGPSSTPLPDWGVYSAAIHRWETILGRVAPPPTIPSKRGTPQLNPQFSEWLMGLPAGWVTDVPGITRNQALKALGNGVVPQQATTALHQLLALEPV